MDQLKRETNILFAELFQTQTEIIKELKLMQKSIARLLEVHIEDWQGIYMLANAIDRNAVLITTYTTHISTKVGLFIERCSPYVQTAGKTPMESMQEGDDEL